MQGRAGHIGAELAMAAPAGGWAGRGGSGQQMLFPCCSLSQLSGWFWVTVLVDQFYRASLLQPQRQGVP